MSDNLANNTRLACNNSKFNWLVFQTTLTQLVQNNS